MNGVMPVIERTVRRAVSLEDRAGAADQIANHEKKMPAGFIRDDGYGITAACRRYLEPLIRGEAPPPYGRDGLPRYVTPEFVAVARKLPRFG